ncbi:hypothetical protein B0I35DRAFT_415495 [Stachybotrys elegans]|uniref:C2H2-type domain-containing protein n=1 Tax=Stachybotrys elegans TaxID=80388 RepID=A0A8K0WJ09_9HYPO|nr:hypothetical protein B0I35DRAFT_415495 [Stachybotrys elegans]
MNEPAAGALTCTWENCKKKYDKLKLLNRHIQSHTRPFECITCKKRFGRAGYLKDHKRVHTGEKLYECCGKEFSTHSNYTTHRRNFHFLGNISTHDLVSTEPSEFTPSELSVHDAAPSANCGCLSSFCLALDVIAKPTMDIVDATMDIVDAMRTARNASERLHEATKLHALTQGFQSPECFSTLVLKICYTYARIVDAVNKEVESAGQRLVWFAFEDAEENTNTDPQAWRKSIMSIIHSDIYGIAGTIDRHELRVGILNEASIALDMMVIWLDPDEENGTTRSWGKTLDDSVQRVVRQQDAVLQ